MHLHREAAAALLLAPLQDAQIVLAGDLDGQGVMMMTKIMALMMTTAMMTILSRRNSCVMKGV